MVVSINKLAKVNFINPEVVESTIFINICLLKLVTQLFEFQLKTVILMKKSTFLKL